MEIKAEFDDARILRALNNLVRAGEDLSPVMVAIAEHLKDSALDSFEKETSPDGAQWPDLSPVTQFLRKKGGYGSTGPKLQRSGALLRRLVTDYGPDFALVGTNLVYAATQQDGAKKGAFGGVRTSLPGRSFFQPTPCGDIPARPFLGVSSEAERNIESAVLEFLGGQWE